MSVFKPTALVPVIVLLALSGSAIASAARHVETHINPHAFAESAAAALQHASRIDQRIPSRYIKQTRCIAVFPHIRTGNQGNPAADNEDKPDIGLVDCRQKDGQWSSTSPVFITLSGQPHEGAASHVFPGLDTNDIQRRQKAYQPLGHQLIVLFSSTGAAKALMRGAYNLGELTIMHSSLKGPTQARVLAWRNNPRSGYTNVDISRTTIGFAKSENRRVYGRNMKPHQLLGNELPAGKISRKLQTYTRALENFAPASEYTGNKINAYYVHHP